MLRRQHNLKLLSVFASIVTFLIPEQGRAQLATSLKQKLGYDDSLDAFGVHGIGGIVGALMTGVFVAESLGGTGLAEGMTIGSQLGAQVVAVLFTVVYCGVLSFIILKVVDGLVGLRVAEDEEDRGLDISLHNEQGYYSEV